MTHIDAAWLSSTYTRAQLIELFHSGTGVIVRIGKHIVPIERVSEAILMYDAANARHAERLASAASKARHSMTRGWWNMPCWNGLSASQQRRLIERGNLPMGYRPEGECTRGAELCVETMHDEAPGPRFYCRLCAIDFLTRQREEQP